MSIETECKKSIVKWITDNPGYIFSQFTFVPEEEGEVLPTAKEFELLTRDVDGWKKEIEDVLSEEEQELYPGTTKRQKYIFEPLNGNLYAHLFLNDNDDVLYVVVGT